MTTEVGELRLRPLGRTGIQISELGLGGYQFTDAFGVSRETALEILRAAQEEGITYFDTAPMYGAGESEELIGRALGGSDSVCISTKIGYLDRTIVRHLGDEAYRDQAAIRRVVAHSLHLLRRDFVEVLLVHEPEWSQWAIDRRTGDSPVLAAAEQLRSEGLVRAVGLGGQDADLMADLVETGRIDVVLSAMHYDLAVQDIRNRLLPATQRRDVGLILGTPLRQGLLARTHPDPQAAMVADADRPKAERVELEGRLRAVYGIADEVGIPLPELAIRYLLSDPSVSSVIPGPRTVEELRLNVASCRKGPLPEDLVRLIADRLAGSSPEESARG